jgi:hypothetical protein
MTTVVEKGSVVATANALDSAAKTLLEQVLVAEAALENARAAAATITDVADRDAGLPRTGTVVSIRDAAQDFLDNGAADSGECNIPICQEAAEEVAALVALVMKAVEKGEQ